MGSLGLAPNLVPRAVAGPITPAEQFLNLVSDPFRSQLQGQAFVTSLITAFGASTVIGLLFCVLRPYNPVVYAPRLRYTDEKHAPPELGKSPLAWLDPVIKTKEQLLVEKIGMDATVFIRFTTMCRNMFICLAIVTCSILLPIYMSQKMDAKGINTFTKMTPQNLDPIKFWAVIGVAWLINLIVIFFLWWNYRGVMKLRRHYFESHEYQISLHARTVMITDIAKKQATDQGVVQLVDSVQQLAVVPRASIGRSVKELPDLIEEHDQIVRDLEEILAKYLKNPDKLPANRPTCKPSKKDPEYRPGLKVDAIDYLGARMQRLEKQILQVRATLDQRNAMSYGFASYQTVEDAHSLAYAARNKHPHGSTIRLAPRPSDLIWTNLPLSPSARRARRFINNLWITLLTLVWVAPNALIAVFLANLGNLGLVWPAFDVELKRHSKQWAIVQGVLAPALTSLFYFVLPMIFRRLAMNAGDSTKTARDRHVTCKLYSFFILNNLIMFSLFGTAWQFIAAIINARQKNKDVLEAIKEGDVWNKLFIALCNVSPFWASWLLQRNLGAAIDLAQLVNLAWGSFQRRLMSPTPRQVIELSAPQPFDYSSYQNLFLFTSSVTLAFGVILPIVLPITAIYFCFDAWLKKYLLLYVFSTKNESGGRSWKILFNRLLFAVLLTDIIVALAVYAKSWGQPNWLAMLVSLAPLPLILLAFKIYCIKAFDTKCDYYCATNEKADNATISDTKSIRSERVAIRFGHPSLYKPLLIPLVHAKAQHMLAKVYHGRLDDEDDMSDITSLADYSDAYSMHSIARKHQRTISKTHKTSPFEFVAEAEMDFENFKNRPDFESEFGEGEMYGNPEDPLSRSQTPTGVRPSHQTGHPVRPSNLRTFSTDSDGPDSETTYPQGYNPASTSSQARTYDSLSAPLALRTDASGQHVNLLDAAAPMGAHQALNEPLNHTNMGGGYHGGRF